LDEGQSLKFQTPDKNKDMNIITTLDTLCTRLLNITNLHLNPTSIRKTSCQQVKFVCFFTWEYQMC